jgi:hypothetical protein
MDVGDYILALKTVSRLNLQHVVISSSGFLHMKQPASRSSNQKACASREPCVDSKYPAEDCFGGAIRVGRAT